MQFAIDTRQEIIGENKGMGQQTGNIMGIRMITIFSRSTIIGTYISDLVHEDMPDVLDLSCTDNLIDTITEMFTSGLKYISDSMYTGFLMTALVLAFITAALTVFAYICLGKDDLKVLGVIKESADDGVLNESE